MLYVIHEFSARARIWAQFEGVEILDVPVGKIGMLLVLVFFPKPILSVLGFSRGILALHTQLAMLNRNRMFDR